MATAKRAKVKAKNMLACEKCSFYTFLVNKENAKYFANYGPKRKVTGFDDDMRFCPADGSPLALKESPACGKCGAAYAPTQRGRFCTQCGTKLS